MKKITVALAGNPNCGKTTLFNNLTGMRHHVGNWPGKTVTVERKEGKIVYDDTILEIVDLPGTYSLSGRSLEEEIAVEYLLNEKPDVVVNIADAAHLERNLYVTLQLIELGVPMILVLNMNRYADAEGIVINTNLLSEMLGIPVVQIEAIDETGKDGLIREILARPDPSRKSIRYDHELEEHVRQAAAITGSRWSAIQALIHGSEEPEIESVRTHLAGIYGVQSGEIFADQRYGFIAGILHESVDHMEAGGKNQSERIDRIVTSRWFGFPIFLAVMYLIFQIVFTVGAPIMDLIDEGFGLLAGFASAGLAEIAAPDWVASLICDGIIGGVGSVVVFLPNIFLLFMLLAILEDSGYLARVAVIMDRVMHKLGLHGKSFIPMILGFGCSVPAIMAARTLGTKRERFLTIMITPFMSCGARLPVYLLLVGIFFAGWSQGLVMFSLYLLGILVALICGLLLRKTLFKGESSAFVLEMPPYRLPTVKGVLIHAGERSSEFLRKAGVIIFPAVLLMWLLASLPFGVEYASPESLIGIAGSTVAPVFAPLGFGFAEAAIAILMGLVAKEVVVGAFGTLYGVGEEGLSDVLMNVFTPLSAYSFMVFILLYMPCLAAMFTIKQETRSWKMTGLAAFGMCAVAWVVSFVVYQGGVLLGFA
ncbi:ferrous iron transport protein B [Methanocorpusculum parvum]|uniref:Ferrous iron transport protein B n=1 Tax=Methanocorpusculum parvum TaxID=2193 RepID=A0AAX0Q7I3_9EURY|nr:ferrous iron transport protein B [Methanocorpusculum parvum]PAV09150.1 iron transporter FeoB [Methanocorpusculum parvum]